jgi:hypothetical protein
MELVTTNGSALIGGGSAAPRRACAPPAAAIARREIVSPRTLCRDIADRCEPRGRPWHSAREAPRTASAAPGRYVHLRSPPSAAGNRLTSYARSLCAVARCGGEYGCASAALSRAAARQVRGAAAGVCTSGRRHRAAGNRLTSDARGLCAAARCGGEYGCASATSARWTAPAWLVTGASDHRDRTRRQESARRFPAARRARRAPTAPCGAHTGRISAAVSADRRGVLVARRFTRRRVRSAARCGQAAASVRKPNRRRPDRRRR